MILSSKNASLYNVYPFPLYNVDSRQHDLPEISRISLKTDAIGGIEICHGNTHKHSIFLSKTNLQDVIVIEIIYV